MVGCLKQLKKSNTKTKTKMFETFDLKQMQKQKQKLKKKRNNLNDITLQAFKLQTTRVQTLHVYVE